MVLTYNLERITEEYFFDVYKYTLYCSTVLDHALCLLQYTVQLFMDY